MSGKRVRIILMITLLIATALCLFACNTDEKKQARLAKEFETYLSKADSFLGNAASYDIHMKASSKSDINGKKSSNMSANGSMAIKIANEGLDISDYEYVFKLTPVGSPVDTEVCIWKGYTYTREGTSKQIAPILSMDALSGYGTDVFSNDIVVDDLFELSKKTKDGSTTFTAKSTSGNFGGLLDELSLPDDTTMEFSMSVTFDNKTYAMKKMDAEVYFYYSTPMKVGNIGYITSNFKVEGNVSMTFTLSATGEDAVEGVGDNVKNDIEQYARNFCTYAAYSESLYSPQFPDDTQQFINSSDGVVKYLGSRDNEFFFYEGRRTHMIIPESPILVLPSRSATSFYNLKTGDVHRIPSRSTATIDTSSTTVTLSFFGGNYEIYDLSDFSLKYSGNIPQEHLNGIYYDGKLLFTKRKSSGYFTYTYDRTIYALDLETGEETEFLTFSSTDDPVIKNLKLSLDHSTNMLYISHFSGATFSLDSELLIYDISTCTLIEDAGKPNFVMEDCAYYDDFIYDRTTGLVRSTTPLSEPYPQIADVVGSMHTADFPSDKYELVYYNAGLSNYYYVLDRDTNEYVYSFYFPFARFYQLSDTEYAGVSDDFSGIVYLDFSKLPDTPLQKYNYLKNVQSKVDKIDENTTRFRLPLNVQKYEFSDRYFDIAGLGFVQVVEIGTWETVLFEEVHEKIISTSISDKNLAVAFMNEIWIYNIETSQKTVITKTNDLRFVHIDDDYLYYYVYTAASKCEFVVHDLATGQEVIKPGMELYVPMAFDGTVDKDNILMLYTHDGIQTLGWFDLNTFAKLTDYNPPSYPDNEREKYSSLPYFAAKTLMEWDNYALVSVCKDRKKYVLLYDTVQKVEITALANAKDQIYIVCGGYVIWETGVGALRFFKLPE